MGEDVVQFVESIEEYELGVGRDVSIAEKLQPYKGPPASTYGNTRFSGLPCRGSLPSSLFCSASRPVLFA